MSNQSAKTASPAPKNITCNLFNPTRARRVIRDGIDGKIITIEPGETKRGVTISRTIAEELRDRNRAEKGSDIQVRPMTDSNDDDEKPEPAPVKEPTIS